MNAILGWLTSPEWAQVVKTLLHSLWQAGLVALVLGLLLRRIASPAWRYRFALGSLGGVLIAAVVSWAVLNQLSHRPETFSQTVLLPDAPLAEQGSPAPDPIGEPIVFRIAATKHTGGDSVKAGWTAWLALVWILGALVMVIRAGVQVAGAERLRRSCKLLADERVTRLLEEAQRAVQLARRVRVAVTDKLTSPAVVGVLVPTLILPLTLLTALTPEQLRFVLLHELAHIRRGDYFANLFQLFMEALFFFNPAVWWISHLVRREREACCDALAIELSGAPVDYAKTLVQVAENVLSPAPAAATAFGDGQREPSSLSDRVQRLLVPGYRPALRLTWRAMLVALLMGGALLFLSAMGARNVVGAVASNVTETASNPILSTNVTLSNQRLSGSQTADLVEFCLPTQLDTFSGDGMVRWSVGGENGLAKQWFWYRTSPGPAADISTTNEVEFPLSRYATTSNGFVDSTSLSLNDLKGQPLVLYVDSGKGSSNPQHQGESEVNAALGGERPIQTSALATRTYAVGQMELARALGMTGPPAGIGPAEMVRDLMVKAGVDIQPPKSVFFKDSLGLLMVRATEAELDAIEKLLVQANREESPVKPSPEKVDETTAPKLVPQQRSAVGPADSSTNLHTRTFSVDANALVKVLESQLVTNVAAGAKRSTEELSRDFRNLISSVGVDLQPPKAVFLNGDGGKLLVRATSQDLDLIESFLEVVNYQPPQVNIKAKLIEVPAEQMQSLLRTVFTNAPDPGTNQFIETLSEARTKVLLGASKTIPSVDVFSCRDVTTLSGHQAQLQVVEVKTFGNGTKTELTNGATQVIPDSEPMSFGVVVDVIPTVMPDGHTIQMRLIPSVNEFVGYDDPGRFYDSPVTPRPPQQLEGRALASDLPAIGSRSGSSPGVVGVTRPVPRYRVRRVTTSVSVWDGQTVMFGNIPNNKIAQTSEVPALGVLPVVGKLFRSESREPGRKQLIVLITPTIVDQAGNRLYPGVQVDIPVW